MPACSLLHELVEPVSKEIAELATEKELAPIEQFLAQCTSADCQPRVYDETGGYVRAAVAHLAFKMIERI